MEKLASEADVSYDSMQTVLKIDLNQSPFKKNKARMLSLTVKAKKIEWSKASFGETQGWQIASSDVDRRKVIHCLGDTQSSQ